MKPIELMHLELVQLHQTISEKEATDYRAGALFGLKSAIELVEIIAKSEGIELHWLKVEENITH